MLTLELRIGRQDIDRVTVTNRTPCEHISQASCDCIAVYEVNGRTLFHRRSDGARQLARTALSVLLDDERWEGARNRDCGEHRTVGGRAWCFDDRTWCYPTSLCDGCEAQNGSDANG